MDIFSFTEYQRLASDSAVFVAMVGLFGLMFLMTAFDGASVHGFGLLGSVNWWRRYVALIGANVILISPVVAVYIINGVTPVGLWEGATLWWHEGSLVGYGIAIATWWVLLSPVQSLLSIVRIERAKSRSRLLEQQWLA